MCSWKVQKWYIYSNLVSSNYVRIPDGSVLLDVGEGSLGQLHRLFAENMNDELQQLGMIFVSHLHADHHLGGFSIIREWNNATKNMMAKKLYVVAPRPYLKWMQEYAAIEDYGFDRCVFLDCEDIENGTAPDLVALYHQLGIRSVQVVPVTHCLLSFGISITTKNGFKFTYSGLNTINIGDCRPSDDLIRIGKNSDLLIHEATFEDDKIEEAIQKNHSTISEAIKTGELYVYLLT